MKNAIDAINREISEAETAFEAAEKDVTIAEMQVEAARKVLEQKKIASQSAMRRHDRLVHALKILSGEVPLPEGPKTEDAETKPKTVPVVKDVKPAEPVPAAPKQEKFFSEASLKNTLPEVFEKIKSIVDWFLASPDGALFTDMLLSIEEFFPGKASANHWLDYYVRRNKSTVITKLERGRFRFTKIPPRAQGAVYRIFLNGENVSHLDIPPQFVADWTHIEKRISALRYFRNDPLINYTVTFSGLNIQITKKAKNE